MAKVRDRRTPTLSISLTPELMAEVDARVQSGLYSSASEFVREALRLMLRVETAREAGPHSPDASPATKLANVLELFDFGSAVQAHKARRENPGISDAELARQALARAEELEGDTVIRAAPERLKKLQRGT